MCTFSLVAELNFAQLSTSFTSLLDVQSLGKCRLQNKAIKLITETETCSTTPHFGRILTYEDETPYTESYYEDLLKPQQQTTANNTNNEVHQVQTAAWGSLCRGVLVLFLRIGFILIQVGSVPVNNVNLILLQNIVDICCVIMTYLLAGHVVAYTGDYSGLVAEGYWIGHPSVDKHEVLIGWQAATVASAISTCGIVGRTHVVGYVLVAVLLSGGIQPLVIHWSWTPKGWMIQGNLAGNKVRFHDYAGSGVVHAVGALTGFIGCRTLGRRILRLREIDDASVGSESSGMALAGLLMVFVGLLSLCLPSFEEDNPKFFTKHLPHVFINGLLSASSSSLIVVLLHFILTRETFNHWTVMRCAQGTVSGLATVSAGIDVYSHEIAIGLGCIAGVIFYLVSRQVFQSALEDYCNIVAAHLTCGIFGCIIVPLNALRNGTNIRSVLFSLAWQAICLAAFLALTTIVILPIFLLLECCGLLRNRWEFVNHERAMVALERHPPRSTMRRIFSPDEGSLYLQPGSSTGTGRRVSVSPRYNRYEQEIADAVAAENQSEQTDIEPKPEPEAEDTRVQTTGLKLRKLRQVHTLPGFEFLFEDWKDSYVRAGTKTDMIDESSTTNASKSSPEIVDAGIKRRKFSLKKFWTTKDDVEAATIKRTFYEELSLASGKFATRKFHAETTTVIGEGNYCLRRTMKRTDLHEELGLQEHSCYRLDLQDTKVLFQSRIDDSSSSETQDDEQTFQRISISDKIMKHSPQNQNTQEVIIHEPNDPQE